MPPKQRGLRGNSLLYTVSVFISIGVWLFGCVPPSSPPAHTPCAMALTPVTDTIKGASTTRRCDTRRNADTGGAYTESCLVSSLHAVTPLRDGADDQASLLDHTSSEYSSGARRSVASEERGADSPRAYCASPPLDRTHVRCDH